MKTNHENRIAKTLASVEGISRAEANPYLFEKIKLRLNENREVVSRGIKWSAVITCVVVLCVNIGSVYFYFEKNNAAKEETVYKNLGSEMGYNQSYNY